jgi:hypothetical protein
MTRIENTEQLKAFILSKDLSQSDIRTLIKATLDVLVIADYTKYEIVDLIDDFERAVLLNGCKGIFLDKSPFEDIQVKDFTKTIFN